MLLFSSGDKFETGICIALNYGHSVHTNTLNGPSVSILGTLRSNDPDGNKNVKKTVGLISKTTISHLHHTFLYISFPFLHDYDVKMPNFAFYGGRKQETTKFYFIF